MTNSESSNRALVTIPIAARLAAAALVAILCVGLLAASRADARRVSGKVRVAKTSSAKQRAAQHRQQVQEQKKKAQKRHESAIQPTSGSTGSTGSSGSGSTGSSGTTGSSGSSGSSGSTAPEQPAASDPTPPAGEETPAKTETPTSPILTPEPEATPEPPKTTESPAPTEPVANPFFDGARISDFWINHSASGAVSEASNPAGGSEKVIKMTVSDKDVYPITPTENPRAELLSPALITAGKEVWLKTKFFIPTDYPTVPNGGWVSLVSFYGAPFEGASPWRVELCGNTIQWERNGTYGYDVPWQTPLEKGRWYTVLTHELFAKNGFVEMWINGQKISFFSSGGYNPHRIAPTEKLAMATMDSSNDEGANSAKIMQYRKLGMFNSGTIYFGPLELGETHASVEG